MTNEEAQNALANLKRYISGGGVVDRGTNNAIDMAIEALSKPEIVRCKDCKHHWTHKCMDSIPIERCDLEQTFYDAEVDYCSLAERRKDG